MKKWQLMLSKLSLLNTHKCLNKQRYEYASVLNMPKFWIWQGFSICELYTVFWIYQNMLWQSSEYVLGFKYARIVNMQESRKVPNMPQYGWICPKRTWIGLNMSEFKITDRVLNIPYFWICLILYIARGHFIEFIERLAYSEPRQGSMVECFGKIIGVLKYFGKNTPS